VPVWNFVRRRIYEDSVTLLRLSLDLETVAGVERAAVMMGTPANRAVLAEAGLLDTEGQTAGPADLVIAVVADGAEAAAAARAVAERVLDARRDAPAARAARPRTLEGGLRALPGATLALISVPGDYAGVEARRALDAGLHVMLFSDNVAVETEIELKRLARERDLFLLGPDCGSAILAGVPLGFANAVPRGRLGVVAASGTGLQEVTCRIAAAGEGISHAIGVGGRDVSDAVGGAMTLAALAALAADAGTEVVVVVAKRPGPSVASRLTETLTLLGKPSVLCAVGGLPALEAGRLAPATGLRPHRAETLEDAAHAAVALARGQPPRPMELSLAPTEVERLAAEQARRLAPGQRYVRGLYAGGTLAWEAAWLLGTRLAHVAPGVGGSGNGHRVVDLGDDAFTVGRPHPMIDGTVRRHWIAREAADPTTAVLLLDLVLGYGAHPDPAGEIVPALQAARRAAASTGRDLSIVASVTGTESDPQGRSRQAAALRAAGAAVMDSNAQAVGLAARVAERAGASGS
jgi:FdrA protein